MLTEVLWPPEARLCFELDKTGLIFPLRRPGGDFYHSLATEALKICDRTELGEVHQLNGTKNYLACIILVAAQDGALENSREVIQHFRAYLPGGDHAWAQLRLFLAVKHFGDAFGMEIPEILRNPRMAWGYSMLRAITDWSTGQDAPSSKRDYIRLLRANKAQLSRGQNPYTPAEPEEFQLIEQALKAPACDSRWENRVKKSRKNLTEALRDYQQTMSALATSWERPGEFAVLFLDDDSKIIGDRGRRESPKGLLGS
jgi:hypothetical protein